MIRKWIWFGDLDKMKEIKLKALRKSLNPGDAEGQSALEFVLVIPLLALVVLAVSQLGLMIYQKNILNQAAREGVRIIATTDSNEMARRAIADICSDFERENLLISIIPGDPASRRTGDNVKVSLGYKCNGFAGIIGKMLGKKILLEASCSMRMECN